MRSKNYLLIGALGFAVGCAGLEAATLTPAPTANRISGPGQGASATVAGVTVSARAEVWKFDPNDLEAKVTPMLVEIDNASDRPLLIRYKDFRLATNAGDQYSAMPPYDIGGTLTETYTVRNPYYPYSGFAVAPYLWRWYPGFPRYGGAFGYDPLYYDPYITQFREVELPTAEMVQRALPEGVLDPGGRVTGFVYFQKVGKHAGSVTFTTDLVDAQNESPLETVTIPFLVKG